MADVAVLPADPASAFKRAQQGKSYWRRVWERLRDDKVTLAVIGVLVMARRAAVARSGPAASGTA